MYTVEETIKLLEKDRVRNVNIINFMKEYPVISIEVAGDSVMVKGISDQQWVYISSKSEEEFHALLKKLDDSDEYFAVMEDWMLPVLTKDKNMTMNLSCMKLYFPDEINLPQCSVDVVELTPDDAQYIFDHYAYQEYTSVEYIIERIRKGISLGIFEDNKLVAWIMTHDDGAMGFLNVLPEYRRKKYGYELTIDMIRRLREQGRVPFVHIEEENTKSMNLARKLGFVEDRRIHWFRVCPSCEKSF
ncbi:MAG: GNAT family N-acetyltransferase [Bacillota bacterium]